MLLKSLGWWEGQPINTTGQATTSDASLVNRSELWYFLLENFYPEIHTGLATLGVRKVKKTLIKLRSSDLAARAPTYYSLLPFHLSPPSFLLLLRLVLVLL